MLQEATGNPEAAAARTLRVTSDAQSCDWGCRSSKIGTLTDICCHFNTSL